ncbi:hypothetical protein ABT390_34030 [Streptomyces aurantiacus]|nr:hypothetical protein [Streptomyces aurantiacus]
MSATTPTGVDAARASAVRLQAVVTTWSITGLVLFGAAWALGLQASWWQRLFLAVPVTVLAWLDTRGIDAVVEMRVSLTRALSDLNWAQIPLAVAGGAWLLGLMADAGQRFAVGAVIAVVAALYHFAPHAAAPAGGAG